MTAPRKAIIYRRVSSQRQNDEGKSLDDQDAELMDYCRAMRWEIIGNYSDAESGRREKTEKRKGLAAALSLACEEKATLVVYDLDRLARSQSMGMKIVESLQDCGAQLVVKSLGIDTTTPAGEMIIGVMFAVAQWGSRNIAAGVQRANRNTMKRLGYRTQGMPPFGLKFNPTTGRREKCDEEIAIIRKVKSAAKDKSLRAAAKILNDEDIPTPGRLRFGRKTKWGAELVRKIAAKKN